jgi:hypothetical protein
VERARGRERKKENRGGDASVMAMIYDTYLERVPEKTVMPRCEKGV